jgi:hypothetical protein
VTVAERPTCRSCGAPLLWARTKRGRAIPLDPQERPDGNVAVTFTLDGDGTPLAQVVARGAGGHVAHFDTCPHAAEHRRRRTREGA